MKRFAGPQWRIPGAALAWIVFTFAFVTLYQAAAALSGIGGFCASGGPYVIETQCPPSVLLFMPLAFPALFLAAGIALVFQGGFSAPLLVWAWPILFIGLGIEFFSTIALGQVFVGILCGTIFVVMGAAPLVFELRGGLRRVILGKTDVNDVRFEEKPDAPRTMYAFGRDDGSASRPATAADWALSLAVSVGSIATGTGLGLWAFAAVAGAPA